MGTLTADIPRLDTHCPHKLPSSCRLTSTPNCCACADERPHSTTYRVYIDGVGFVQRGTRWQSYCWFCKSFWDARVSAAGLSPSDTKIPEDPGQDEFCERWFEWHRGWRMDGEERVMLEGEPLRDADPGFLPRTREEMERGRRAVLQSDAVRAGRPRETAAEPHVSLEDALDELLEEATEDESEGDEVYEVTTSAAVVPPTAQQENQSRLDEAYAEAQTAVEAAQRVRDRAEARLNNADAELAVVRERLRRIRRQQITAGNFARVFGTREDVNNEDYVSPITSMFIRQAQWGRQNAERQRMLQEQTDALRNFADIREQIAPDAQEDEVARATQAVEAVHREISRQPVTGPPQYIGDSHTFLPPSEALSDLPHTTRLDSIRASLRANPSSFPSYLLPRAAPLEPSFPGLDGDARPAPRPENEMHAKLECKICLQQVADTACLPCGHLSMCEWCAEQWVPTREGDKTRPRDKGVRCPCCRARVKSRVRIYPG